MIPMAYFRRASSTMVLPSLWYFSSFSQLGLGLLVGTMIQLITFTGYEAVVYRSMPHSYGTLEMNSKEFL